MYLEELDRLMAAITEPVKTYRERAVDETFEDAESGKVTSGITGDTAGKVSLDVGADSEESSRRQSTTSHQVDIEDKVIFPLLNRNLSRTLELAEARLYVLLDEWSSLPADIQPYLAEFLKRGVLTVQRATLKIASLEYRSHFTKLDTQPGMGFELGADIATAQDLDEYYVFDRNPEQITNTYADMLLRHLNSELDGNYLNAKYRVSTGKDLASRLFTERKTFEELARASEGVVRDLINIFTSAFFDAQRRSRDSIDRKSILDAARQWFEQDKQQYLDDHLQAVLRKIVDEVIGTRRARSFLLPRGLEWDPTIQRLFDARVLHLMQRGYADKDNPGARYNIYTLDYGTYVDLLGTSQQPTLDFLEPGSESDLIVPFDDKRSIRRIVLSEEVLS